MNRATHIVIIIVVLLFCGAWLFSQDSLAEETRDLELEQEMAWLKAETYVITASRLLQNIKKAPASISVITEKQIRQMGAKNLADIIARAVPGMSSWRHYRGEFQASSRGDNSTLSLNILLMIDSHPVNEVQTGGWTWMYDLLTIDNIERIEFVRGPGSALYGANAFSGVINVITKSAKDIDGFEMSAGTGSENTQQYNLLCGKVFNDLEVTFNLNYFNTNGFRELIEADYQTQIDGYFTKFGFPAASLAPGRMKGDDAKYDIALNLKYAGFRLDGKYIDRKRDLPVGWFAALNHKSVSSAKDYFMTLNYETTFSERLDVKVKAYGNGYDLNQDFQLFPPGTVRITPAGHPAVWQNGMLSETSLETSRLGTEFQTTYKMSENNSVVAGITCEKMKVSDISHWANFLPTPNPIVFTPLQVIRKLPDAYVQDSKSRDFKAMFMEDVWSITNEICLTSGARYDYYSDFGGAFSPRAGVTWEFMKGYDLKLLYGHAFRAPSFYELHDPFVGNADLDPEQVDTFEISFGAELTSSLSGRLTFFYKEAKDIIVPDSDLSPWVYTNRGERRDHGIEAEVKYDFERGTYLGANYSYMDQDNTTPGPGHMGDVMINVRVSRYLNLYADVNFIEDIKRWRGDSRGGPSGYETVNLTLIARKILKGHEGLELRASIYNLLDEGYVYYSGTRELANDFPAQGINYMLEIKYAL